MFIIHARIVLTENLVHLYLSKRNVRFRFPYYVVLSSDPRPSSVVLTKKPLYLFEFNPPSYVKCVPESTFHFCKIAPAVVGIQPAILPLIHSQTPPPATHRRLAPESTLQKPSNRARVVGERRRGSSKPSNQARVPGERRRGS